MNKKTIIALGFASLAAQAASNVGLADCGGLFLLHLSDKHFSAKSCGVRDSFEIDNFDVHGSFYHAAIQARYSEKWHIKGLSKFNIASAGFESHYKYATLGVNVNSLPMVQSSISVHREDSLFRVNAGIARGSVNIGNISWIPDKTTEMVGTISVDWESHILFRELSAESKINKHYVNLSLMHVKTSPHNPDKEHYIRDSVNTLVLGAQYKYDFSRSRLEAGYTFADVDITLYGIFHNEESRKRFLYFPLDASLHLLFTKWEWEHLKMHLEYVHLSGMLHSNPNRFYETLAPNRALSASVIKGLSFAFLQKTFRTEADLDAFGIMGGGSYRWDLGKRYVFSPSVGLDVFGASGDVNIDKEIETTKVFGTVKTVYESTKRKLNSIGSILSLGCEIRRTGNIELSLDYGIMQIIPFYIDYKDYKANQETAPTKQQGGKGSGKKQGSVTKDKDKSGSLEQDASALLFRNGFATHLSVGIRF